MTQTIASPCVAGARSCHQSRPLRGVGVLLERHDLVAVKLEHMAERRVELRAAIFHRAAIAAEHNDMVAAVYERAGHNAEVVDRCQQACKHTSPTAWGPT